MIVAASAGQRQAEHRAADAVDGVFVCQMPRIAVLYGAKSTTDREKPGGNVAFILIALRAALDQVARNLNLYKSVVGNVIVEGLNDPVPVSPCQRNGVIGIIAGRVGITHKIQPVSSPTLAIMRAVQQTINDSLKGVGLMIMNECVDFVRCRWQSDQIKCRPSQQRLPIGWFHWRELLLFESIVHKAIDHVRGPGILNPRRRDTLNRLKRPMFAGRDVAI